MSLDLRETQPEDVKQKNNSAKKRLATYGNVLVSGYGFKLGSGTGLFGKRNWKKRFFILPVDLAKNVWIFSKIQLW